MKILLVCISFLLASVGARAEDSSPFAQALKEYREHSAAKPAPTGRFETGIKSVLAADKLNPPPRGQILFIGSSIFKRWSKLGEQMAPLPVLNRAFGGSRTSDILERTDQLVLPYEPKVIVYYAGGNDINNREPAAAVFGRMHDFAQRVHAKLPATKIIFVGIDKAPQKQERWGTVDAANELIRKYCATVGNLKFIDANPVTHDERGVPRLELYEEDKLHWRPEAYERLAALLKPILSQTWAEVAK